MTATAPPARDIAITKIKAIFFVSTAGVLFILISPFEVKVTITDNWADK